VHEGWHFVGYGHDGFAGPTPPSIPRLLSLVNGEASLSIENVSKYWQAGIQTIHSVLKLTRVSEPSFRAGRTYDSDL